MFGRSLARLGRGEGGEGSTRDGWFDPPKDSVAAVDQPFPSATDRRPSAQTPPHLGSPARGSPSFALIGRSEQRRGGVSRLLDSQGRYGLGWKAVMTPTGERARISSGKRTRRGARRIRFWNGRGSMSVESTLLFVAEARASERTRDGARRAGARVGSGGDRSLVADVIRIRRDGLSAIMKFPCGVPELDSGV